MAVIATIVFLIAIFVFLTAPRTTERERMGFYRHTQFAHRGYFCKEEGIPENSMPAFRAAIDRDYGIELDIQLTKDGQIVVFHDYNLKRLFGVSRPVKNCTMKQLRSLRFPGTRERIPRLKEVLDLVGGRVPLLIELKVPDRSTTLCEKVYDMLKDYPGAYIVESFNSFSLRWFKKNANGILRGQLAERVPRKGGVNQRFARFMLENLLGNFLSRPDFIAYQYLDLPQPVVTYLRAFFQTPIAVWTLQTERELKKGQRDYEMQIFEKHGVNYESPRPERGR